MIEFTKIELNTIRQLITNEKYELEARLRHGETNTLYVKAYQNRIRQCQDILNKINDVLHAS